MSDEDLEAKLASLRQQHGDLDRAIDAMSASGSPDLLAIQRLKKRKLMLKDQIRVIENMLLPDIIA